jgi:hypothetical protein
MLLSLILKLFSIRDNNPPDIKLMKILYDATANYFQSTGALKINQSNLTKEETAIKLEAQAEEVSNFMDSIFEQITAFQKKLIARNK